MLEREREADFVCLPGEGLFLSPVCFYTVEIFIERSLFLEFLYHHLHSPNDENS